MVLRLPREDEEQEFLRAHRATTPDVPNFLHYYDEGCPSHIISPCCDSGLAESSCRRIMCPSTFLFGFDGSRIVGRVSIRHELNDFLLREGGHIGYVVVPEFRRRGYATAMLRRSLEIARHDLGIDRACC